MILIKIADAARTAMRETELSEYAKARLAAASSEKRRQETVLGDAVRRALLSEAGAEDEPIAIGEHGKPYLSDRREVAFNVSHSGVLAAGVIATESEGELGIDVELIDRARGDERRSRIMRRAFTDAETAKVAASADPVSEFYVVWTKKEALLKYTGEGITRPLISVDTEAETLPCMLRTFTVTGSDGEEYAVSVALPEACEKLTLTVEHI